MPLRVLMLWDDLENTPNLPTTIVDFRGFDSNIILILRGGILRPIADFLESLSQTMLVECNVSREIGRRRDCMAGSRCFQGHSLL